MLLKLALLHDCSTDEEFSDYTRQFYFPGASSEEVAPLLALYPNDPAQGSPFGTGEDNQLAPMYKRVAAFEGDFLFQSQRRSLLTLRSSKQPAWTYSTSISLLSHLSVRVFESSFTAGLSPLPLLTVVERSPFPGVGVVRFLSSYFSFNTEGRI